MPLNRFSLPSRRKISYLAWLFFPDFKLNLLPYRLDLPPLPLSPADQIANEKPLEDRNQRHREDEENAGERREVEQKAERRVNVAKGSL